MSNVVPRNASNEIVFDIIRGWVDVLSKQDYQSVFENLGHSIPIYKGSADTIRSAIESYRSPEYYPVVSTFVVSDWRTARGGNASPQREVIWFKPNSIKMAGAVLFDLPLNGQWSDLTADFVMFESTREDDGFNLVLEEISSAKQKARAQEAFDAD